MATLKRGSILHFPLRIDSKDHHNSVLSPPKTARNGLDDHGYPRLSGRETEAVGCYGEFTRKLRARANAAMRSEEQLRRIYQARIMASVAATRRFKDAVAPRRRQKVFSEDQEDGTIAQMFGPIGTASKRSMEFGIESLKCNSTFLKWTPTAPHPAASRRISVC
jgi:hypothetical protein